MEKITTKAELIDNLENVQAVEILARDGYVKDARIFQNKQIIETVGKIKIDEDKHIAILGKLIELLKGG